MRAVFIVLACCTAQALGLLIPMPSQRVTKLAKKESLQQGPSRRGPTSLSHRFPRMCAREEEGEVDWRELRARLVANEKAPPSDLSSPAFASSASFVYETPLIEQGTILLGGTKMEFGFALRQQVKKFINIFL